MNVSDLRQKVRQKRLSLTRFSEEEEQEKDAVAAFDNEAYESTSLEEIPQGEEAGGRLRPLSSRRQPKQRANEGNKWVAEIPEEELESELSPTPSTPVDSNGRGNDGGGGGGGGGSDSPPVSRSSTATFGGSRTGTPMLDQTLSAAFRDKIRSRLKVAKKKIKSEDSQRRESWEDLDPGLVEELEARLKDRFQWKRALDNLLESQQSQDPNAPSLQEAYHFFTRNVDLDIKPNAKAPDKDKGGEQTIDIEDERHEGEAKDEDGDGDENLLLVEEVFASVFEKYLCERSAPLIKPRAERLEEESRFLYFPTAAPVAPELKFGTYNPADDGLYVEETSKHLLFNEASLNKLEQRVFKESGTKWFERITSLFSAIPTQFLTWNWFSWGKSDPSNLLVFEPPTTLEGLAMARNAAKVPKYEMIISLFSLTFTCHELFSEEHTAARHLLGVYESFQAMSEDKSVALLTQKLVALRVSISNLEAGAKETDRETREPDEEVFAEKESRLKEYQEQVVNVLTQRRETIKRFRSLLLSVLSSWEEIEEVRKRNGFQSTNIKLTFEEKTSDDNEKAENRQLNELMKEGFDAELKWYREKDERATEQYRKELRNWKQWQRNKRRMSRIDGEAPPVPSPEREDKGATGDEMLVKPEAPKLVSDEQELMDRIKKDSYLLDGRLPGEPVFSEVALIRSCPISGYKECPKFEQKRRNDVGRLRFFAEIVVEGEPMGRTSDRELNCNFFISWDHDFQLKLFNETQDIRLNIYQTSGSRTQLLAQTFVPLPESWMTSNVTNSVGTNSLDFSSDLSGKHSIISGTVKYSAYWSVNHEGVALCPQKDSWSIPVDVNLEQLRHWKERNWSQLDPNDPDNIMLLERIKEYEEMLKRNPDLEETFHLDPAMKEFEFCSSEDIENNPRLKMLTLRAQGAAHLKNVPVPLDEREIPLNLLEKSLKAPDTALKAKKGVEAKHEKALKILGKVREQLLRQSQGRFDRPRTLEDLVIEDQSDGLNFAFDFFTATATKRPLHPARKERKKIFGSLVTGSEIKLIVTVMHALNLPVRSSSSETVRRSSFGELDFSCENKVCPFIEAVFQRESYRTSTAEGPQPTWNETLSLRFRAPNDDYSPSSLTKISDFVYLNLYDEVASNESKEVIGGDIGSPRVERRWLGSLRIPFSTLYLNSKIEGTFALKAPPVLLGYEYDARTWNLGRTSSNSGNGNALKNTYLTLFLTIDPTLQLPEPLTLKCDSIEDETVLQFAKKWQQELRRVFPDRETKVMTIDLSAKWVLVTRYLRPIKPPEELMMNAPITEEMMQRLARFVSLIPSVPDSIALPGVGDIWSTCDQFLEMLMGDEEEHAILLCNFFLYLGKRAGVLLGSGIPEGSTAYVIVWEYTGEEASVWNSTSGERFSVSDSFLPLNAVGCIITPDNVYGNVQKHEHPNRLVYDVTKTSSWRPFYSRKFPSPGLFSVQPDILVYGSSDHEYALELQERLEKHLRESLMRWRKRSRTFFNRSCIQQIRKILPRLERKFGRLQQTDLIQDLHDILIVHKMTGFPLNMPYTDIDSITEAVYATGVHLVADKRVEFALAVYVHPYPCNILSVWVYIAALT